MGAPAARGLALGAAGGRGAHHPLTLCPVRHFCECVYVCEHMLYVCEGVCAWEEDTCAGMWPTYQPQGLCPLCPLVWDTLSSIVLSNVTFSETPPFRTLFK